MGIMTIPLSRLETTLEATLTECADSGQAIIVALPDQRLVAIQSLEPAEDDSLMDDLLQSNPEFQKLVAESKASPRKPFPPDRWTLLTGSRVRTVVPRGGRSRDYGR